MAENTPKLSQSADRFQFYDDGGRFHSFPMSFAVMAQHMCREHGMSVRQINLALGLTDRRVREVLGTGTEVTE